MEKRNIKVNKIKAASIFIILFLLAMYNLSLCQQSFIITGFSEEYYGKINIEDTTQEYSKGSTEIYETKTNKQLIKLALDEVSTSGQIIKKERINYKDQSYIIYQDFNFDGIKDLALWEGNYSCYGGPSFKIYLANKNGFVYDEDFTELVENYCGMFQVNYKEKKIHTSVKSGCCWHQYSDFIVENNKPKAIKIIEEDFMSNSPYIIHKEQIFNGKKMITTIKNLIDLNQDVGRFLLQFKIQNQKKEIILFTDENILHYAIIKNGEVEFYHPTSNQSSNFIWNKKTNEIILTFKNKEATYIIYETSSQANKKIGIKVITNAKTVDLKGETSSIKGGLEELIKVKRENLTIVTK